MRKGQRVQIIDGVLEGERATVAGHPETGEHLMDGGFVWVVFDRDRASLPEKRALLYPCWLDIDHLQIIS